ncbi:MAG TPA: P-loop NTPase fold protein [Alphaproteobacteria bacterium]|jgi:energy-coupling factor transporter ATP-binding protein EcfA2
MRLTPKIPKIGESEGFSNSDLFELKGFGERLSNLIIKINEPLVIVLDGAWGSGKSTFIKQWSGVLREQRTPVIIFDAFENDYHEDAFFTLASQVIEQAQKILGKTRTTKQFIEQTKKVGRVLVPLTAKLMIRAASLGALSASDLTESSDEIMKTISGDVSETIERVLDDKIKKIESDKLAIESFRSHLARLAGAMSEKLADVTDKASHLPPLVIVIDELDRCRPPFSINLLERIKHLFSVEGVCFVLVTHLPQLAVAIRGSYGQDMNAERYLEKFYHLKLSLPDDTRTGGPKKKYEKYVDYLWSSMELATDDPHWDALLQGGIVNFSYSYSLSYRTIERVVSCVALVTAATSKRNLRWPPLIVGLCVMKVENPSLYERVKNGVLEWEDAFKFLNMTPWNDQAAYDFYYRSWKFALSKNLSNEGWEEQYFSELHRYNLRRERIIPFMIGYIEELFQTKS